MEFDFTPDSSSLVIPKNVYRPIVKCPHCQSVYVDNIRCESCGKSLNESTIGDPFSTRSFYSLKEKYLGQLNYFEKRWPIFENKNNSNARSYKRNLIKRFKDINRALNSDRLINQKNRQLFFIEIKDIVDELIEYRVNFFELKNCIFDDLEEGLLGGEMINYFKEKMFVNERPQNILQFFNNYKIGYLLSLKLICYFIIFVTIAIYTSIKFKYLLSN
jgi:hypothetical protein